MKFNWALIKITLAFSLLFTFSTSYSTDIDPKVTKQKYNLLIKPAVKLGYSLTKATLYSFEDENINVPSNLNAESHKIIKKVKNSFRQSKVQRLGVELAAENTKMAVAATAYGIATTSSASGIGPIITGLVASVVMRGIDEAATSVIQKNQELVVSNLLVHRKAIEQATGVTLEELRTKDSSELRKAFKDIDLIDSSLQEQIESYSDDKTNRLAAVEELNLEVTIAAVKNTSIESFKRIASNKGKILENKIKFDDFVVKSNKFQNSLLKTLDHHGEKLDRLDKSVLNLNSKMAEVNQTLSSHGKQLTFLSDIAFSQMGPGQKAKALKTGIFADRFSCKKGMEEKECKNQETLKTGLISQFEAEENVMRNVKDFSSFTRDISSISNIANNLGIDAPMLNEAVKVSSAASQAFNAYISGNPLGAISAVSSLFGGSKPDPAARRHKQMMNYLSKQFAAIHKQFDSVHKQFEEVQKQFQAVHQQFDVVNSKLNYIIKNQGKILKGLEQLSIQSAEQYRALDERLDNAQFDIKLTLEIVKKLLRDKWQSCYYIYNEAIKGADRYHLSKNFTDFTNIDGLFSFIDYAGNSISSFDCLNTAATNFNSLNNINSFGNFLSLKYALNNEQQLLASNPDAFKDIGEGRKYFNFDELRTYVEKIHNKNLLLLSLKKGFKKSDWQKIFLQSSIPATTVLPQLIPDNPCVSKNKDGTPYLGDSFQSNICDIRVKDTPKITTEKKYYYSKLMLSEPADIYFALELTDWILLGSRIVDITRKGEFHDDKYEFLKYVNSPQYQPFGTTILKSLEFVLNYVIASRSMLYSQATLNALYSAFENKNTENFSITTSLLSENKYLKHNLAVKILFDNFIGKGSKNVLKEISHQTMLGIILNDEDHSIGGLAKLFNKKKYYRIIFNEEKGWPDVCFASKMDSGGVFSAWDICTSFPTSNSLEKGSIVLPEFIFQLNSARNRVLDRISEYDVFSSLSNDESISLINSLGY
jgi:hypothetical protein